MIRTALLACFLTAACWPSFAQGDAAPANVLSVTAPAGLRLKAGSISEVRLKLALRAGYHVNSNTPSDKYLIPLKLTWNPPSNQSPAEVAEVVFPKPQFEKVAFSPNPLSVYTGEFELITRFKVPATAAPGPAALIGKVRYQACNDRMCLAPKNLDVAMQVDIVK
jgi:DsbC/DsbD-like thiol-disulfide interchange protein